jgi:hypothetical protein
VNETADTVALRLEPTESIGCFLESGVNGTVEYNALRLEPREGKMGFRIGSEKEL